MLRFPALLYVYLEDLEFSIYNTIIQESYLFLSYILGIYGIRLSKDPNSLYNVD